jgi:hypothetical protein
MIIPCLGRRRLARMKEYRGSGDTQQNCTSSGHLFNIEPFEVPVNRLFSSLSGFKGFGICCPPCVGACTFLE